MITWWTAEDRWGELWLYARCGGLVHRSLVSRYVDDPVGWETHVEWVERRVRAASGTG